MKIFIATIGTRGDVQPYVALGKGLAAAGHEVTIATCARFQDFVESAGLRYGFVEDTILQFLDTDAGREVMERTSGLFRTVGAHFRLMKTIGPIQERMHDQIWDAAQAAGPDVIVFHPKGLIAQIIAEKLGVPAIFASPLPLIVPTGDFPCMGFPRLPLGRGYNRATFRIVNTMMNLVGGRYVRTWRKRTGTPARGRNFSILGGPDGRQLPALFAYSSHVVPRPSDWPDNAAVTGYWFLERGEGWTPPADLLRFLDAGPAPIYVGFGSMAGKHPERLARTVVDALAAGGHRGVIARGWGGLEAGDLPETVFAIDEAPHDWLFPRMAGVVHHGGAGSTAAGLRAGKPTLIVPFIADQPFWGRRVHALGLGPAPIPHKKLTVKKLAAAFDTLAGDDAMRRRAGEMGERIRQENGVENAVRFIEQVGLSAGL